MRRVMPPQRLRIHKAACPPVCRLARGRDGLTLGASAAPTGAAVCDWPQIQLSVASPYPTAGLSASAGGAMVLSWLPGVVQSIVVPDLAQAFDRRPPGLAEARGAGRANAALLRADDGWRAVVLPSLGDRISDLGPGPVAISASAQQVAVHDAGTTVVVPLAGGAPLAEYPGEVDALAFAGEELWISARRRGRAGRIARTRDRGADSGARRCGGRRARARPRGRRTSSGACPPGPPATRWRPAVDEVRAISLSDDGDVGDACRARGRRGRPRQRRRGWGICHWRLGHRHGRRSTHRRRRRVGPGADRSRRGVRMSTRPLPPQPVVADDPGPWSGILDVLQRRGVRPGRRRAEPPNGLMLMPPPQQTSVTARRPGRVAGDRRCRARCGRSRRHGSPPWR